MRDYDYIAKYKSYAYRIKEYDKLINKENVNMKLKIKYLDGAKELVDNKKGDLIDVYAYEDIFIPFMGYGMVNLGFALELPEGHMAKLVPRSSAFKKWGIIQTNSVGI